MNRLLLPLLLALLVPASAQDLAISKVGGNNDYRYYGQSGGVAAYSIATTSCNVGNLVVLWNDSIDQAPAIATNMYRISNGQMVQLGYSWLKDGFCAVNENSCGSCQSTSCNTLGLGCADTYSAGLNDGAGGVSKFQINPTTGAWPSGAWQGPVGSLPLRGRLQVPVSELMDSNSTYVSESIYISEHDQGAGNGRNNASWQEFRFNAIDSISNLGNVQMFNPAIYAWKDRHPDVHIDEVVNFNEGGSGVHGYYFVGSKATAMGGGMYRYDYAIMNMNSAQGVGAFEFQADAAARGISFRDVDPHSGSPWSGQDWTFSANGANRRWSSLTTYNRDPNGNAIRWGTMYSFSLTTMTEPRASLGQASLELYAPGVGSNLSADVILPSDEGGNLPPVVDAGPDGMGSIGLPVLLDADVSDDGLPTGNLDYLWEKVSGPGGVNFALNFLEDTPATFYVPGVYVLRLTVSDGELTSFDERVFTAAEPNTPPVVTAGPDQTARTGTPTYLAGSFQFGTPWTVDVQWEVVSGPANVNFAFSQQAGTEATFYVEGLYELRLNAASGALSSSDTVLVQVDDSALVIDAGADLSASVNTPVNLMGSFQAAQPWLVNLNWARVSGPGAVNFSLQQSPQTMATFYVPGTYLLRLSGSDANYAGFDEVTVVVP